MISNEDVSKTQAPRGHWFRTMKARQAIREMQNQLAQTQLTVFYRHLFFYSGGSQSFSFKLKKKTTCRTNVHPVLSCKIPIETFMQHQSWSLSIGQIRAVFRPTHRSHPKKRWVLGIGESSLENGETTNWQLWAQNQSPLDGFEHVTVNPNLYGCFWFPWKVVGSI